jgi:hypothetical protein
VRDEITDTVCRVLIVTDEDEGALSWVTRAHLARWGVDERDARAAADRNQARLIAALALEIKDVDEMKIGMVPLESALKASVILAPTFKQLAAPLGWPVLAVVPCRDFIYLLAERDRALLGRMGAVVQREYRGSGYPITTEVLRIADDGIEAIGKFPE